MTISASNLYIVVTYISYSGISGDTGTLFTDRKEAETAAEEASKHALCGMSLKYTVMDLDDYISEVRSEARDEGRRDERDAY
jgi:hypothetical protein